MAFLGLHHVQVAIPAGGEDEARRFYGGLLGLPEVPKPVPLRARGGCWFLVGDGELHLGAEEAFAPARKAHPAFLVQDLEALRAALEQAGMRTDEDAQVEGHQRFYVNDPFGNRLEFLER